MSWIYLLIAGIFEICFTTSLKLTEGFTKLIPSIAFLFFAVLSFLALNRAISTIPLGTAYAIWTGIGASGTAIIAVFFFGEQLSAWQVFFLITLICSIVGLKLFSPA